MKHDEFIGQVQYRARLSSRGAAERATRATLETLAERLAGGEAKDLAAQLPPEIAEYLQGGWSAMGERFSLAEFFRRVSQREGADLPDAVFHARAVIEVLSEAVSQGEMDDVRAQLPAEFDRLFEAGSSGQMPAAE
jgi:uncharacterized protein (DUF2267 family)